MAQKILKPASIDRYFKPAPKQEVTPEPKRAPSPPHEYTLADNEAIAFVVMFRSRFHDAFPRSCPNFGPQDIERAVGGELPDELAERILCALLGLVLNRKKDVESVPPFPCSTTLRRRIQVVGVDGSNSSTQARTLWPSPRGRDFSKPKSVAERMERGESYPWRQNFQQHDGGRAGMHANLDPVWQSALLTRRHS